MDNNTFNHLIVQHGILKSFHIAKKVSKKDIGDIKALTDSLKTAVNRNLIPGIIHPESNSEQGVEVKRIQPDNTPSFKNDEKKMFKLNNLSATVANKFVDNEFSKDEVCYLILSMLSILGLTDEDFKQFHKKYNNLQDDSDEDDSDDEPSF
jgi:co-chaperonin GroES (HSP10)